MENISKKQEGNKVNTLLANGFISPKYELPKASEKNRYFSKPLMLLVGKRKYRGVFSLHFNKFYKDGFHIENNSFEIDKVNGWRLLKAGC